MPDKAKAPITQIIQNNTRLKNRNDFRNGHSSKPFPTNWEIPGNEVRVVSDGDTRVVEKKLAIKAAEAHGLTLVLIARPEGGPPVCRIADLGKLKYEAGKAKKKEKVQKTKEIGLHPNIDPHDLGTKIRQARNFLKDGDRIVFRLTFRGRERAHKNIGIDILEKIKNELKEDSLFDLIQTNGGTSLLRGQPKVGQRKENH